MSKNTENMVAAARVAMEDQVFVPTVLQKLAERGYEVQTEEQLGEVFKIASALRDGIASGEVAPVPARAIGENGLDKAATAAVEKDMLHFAPDFEIELEEIDPIIKEAAAVLIMAAMEAQK